MKRDVETIRKLVSSAEPHERALGLIWLARQRLYALSGELVVRLHDKSAEVRAAAAWGLDVISDPLTISALVEAMYDDDFSVRSNAGWALVHMAERFVPELVVPEITPVLQDRYNANAREMAYLVLRNIGGELASEVIRQYWQR